MVVPLENTELPRAHVKKVVKGKLSELAKAQFNQDKDIPVQKEAFQAFAESTKIFIHYLSATANDICRESKRQTINAEDVLRALEDLEFKEFVEPLRNCLEGFKKKSSNKKSAVPASSKRKASSSSSKSKGKARQVLETVPVKNNEEAVADEDDDEMMQ